MVNHWVIFADKQRRTEDPGDYNRPQPTDEDLQKVRHFIEAEFPYEEAQRLLGSQVERKLGLLVAAMFNLGFDAGLGHNTLYANGYAAGLKDAEGMLAEAVTQKLKDTGHGR